MGNFVSAGTVFNNLKVINEEVISEQLRLKWCNFVP